MELYISIIGAIVAVGVAILGSILTNGNNIKLQKRKLKEEHYIAYISALHNLATNPGRVDFLSKYTYSKDALMLIANEDVIKRVLKYEYDFQNGGHQEV